MVEYCFESIAPDQSTNSPIDAHTWAVLVAALVAGNQVGCAQLYRDITLSFHHTTSLIMKFLPS
jgi:hypothetical protein